ncbi:MAG: carbohydrate ABC transporter permease [Bacilli bacterium]|nr:carbohydrate ABC transporter permease [Bacilli bacterium]
MIDPRIKEMRQKLNVIENDLRRINKTLPVEDRFDLASFRNNVHNVNVSGDTRYLDDFFSSYLGQKINGVYAKLSEEQPRGYIAEHYDSVEKLIHGVHEIVEAMYLGEGRKPRSEAYIAKHLKPVVASDRVNIISMWRKENRDAETFKMVLLGNQERKGVIPATIIYVLLTLFGFVFLYPILYMVAYSLMSTSDLVDPSVRYVPTGAEWSNYAEAWLVLDYPKVFWQTVLVSVVPALCQAVVCAITGWGLARFQFKGKKVLFGLIIFTFIVPSCLIMLPTVSLYASMNITGNVLSYVLPAIFGQGFKSAVFILIFYNYFKAIPQSIIEAASIDGAGTIKTFLRIGLPSARSAILLTILLSVVWYYNETVLASVYFGSAITTLPLGIENFKSSFDSMYQGSTEGKSINEAIYMAGTILNILPLVVLYVFTQKFFVQGMDKAGITGE